MVINSCPNGHILAAYNKGHIILKALECDLDAQEQTVDIMKV